MNSINIKFPGEVRNEIRANTNANIKTQNLYELFQNNNEINDNYRKWSVANARAVRENSILSDVEYASTKAYCKIYIKFDALAGLLASLSMAIYRLAATVFEFINPPPEENSILPLFLSGAINPNECVTQLLDRNLCTIETSQDMCSVLASMDFSQAKELLSGTGRRHQKLIHNPTAFSLGGNPDTLSYGYYLLPYMKDLESSQIEELLFLPNSSGGTLMHDWAFVNKAYREGLFDKLGPDAHYRIFSQQNKKGNTVLHHRLGLFVKYLEKMSDEKVEKLLSLVAENKETPLHKDIKSVDILFTLKPDQQKRILLMRNAKGESIFDKMVYLTWVDSPPNTPINKIFEGPEYFLTLGLKADEIAELLINHFKTISFTINEITISHPRRIDDASDRYIRGVLTNFFLLKTIHLMELLPSEHLRSLFSCKVVYNLFSTDSHDQTLLAVCIGYEVKGVLQKDIMKSLFKHAMGFEYPQFSGDRDFIRQYCKALISKISAVTRTFFPNKIVTVTQKGSEEYQALRFVWIAIGHHIGSWLKDVPDAYVKGFFEWLPAVDIVGRGDVLFELVKVLPEKKEPWRYITPLLMKLPPDEFKKCLEKEEKYALFIKGFRNNEFSKEALNYLFGVDYTPTDAPLTDGQLAWYINQWTTKSCQKSEIDKVRILSFLTLLKIDIVPFLPSLTRDELEALCIEMPHRVMDLKFQRMQVREAHFQEGTVINYPAPSLVDYHKITLIGEEFSFFDYIFSFFNEPREVEEMFIGRVLRAAETQAVQAGKPLSANTRFCLWAMEKKVRLNTHFTGNSRDEDARRMEYEVFCNYLSHIFHANAIGEAPGDVEDKNKLLASIEETFQMCFPRWMKDAQQYYMCRPGAVEVRENNAPLKDRVLDKLRLERVDILSTRVYDHNDEQTIHHINGALDSLRVELGTGLESTGDMFAYLRHKAQYRAAFNMFYTKEFLINLFLEHVNGQKEHENSTDPSAITPDEVEECLLKSKSAKIWRKREYEAVAAKARTMEKRGEKPEEIEAMLSKYDITWLVGDTYDVGYRKLNTSYGMNKLLLQRGAEDVALRQKVEAQESLLNQLRETEDHNKKKKLLIDNKWMIPGDPLEEALSSASIAEAQKINFLQRAIYDEKRRFTPEAMVYFLAEMGVLTL